MSAMTFLSENVKRLRETYAMSQKDLAAAIGTSHPRISEIEKGHGNPTLKTLELIAAAFNVTVADLVSKHPQKKSQKIA